MFTCKKHTFDTLEVKQSKFIAHIMPYSEFESRLETLKNEHPKARHFVTAFRYINEHEQIVEGSSDDGEPKGTSGKPSLHVLQGNELINVAVIIVRYFGGTKLGTGGLVRAYSDAVNLVIESMELYEYKKLSELIFSCSYHELGKVEYILGKFDIDILEKDFSDNVTCKVEATHTQLESMKSELERIITIL
jgi:uncharacterized YigZ family protein